VLRAQGDQKEALSHHMKAAHNAPDDARAQYELGKTQFDMGDYLGSEESLSRSTMLDPRDPEAWFMLGETRRASSKWEGASTAYRHVIEIDVNHRAAYNALGVSLYYENKLDDAEVVLTEALRLDPAFPPPYFNLGIVYAKLGKNGLAIGAFEKFLAIAPKDDSDAPVARKKLAELKRKGGRGK
jgi:Flp pilus assembly protein TadD